MRQRLVFLRQRVHHRRTEAQKDVAFAILAGTSLEIPGRERGGFGIAETSQAGLNLGSDHRGIRWVLIISKEACLEAEGLWHRATMLFDLEKTGNLIEAGFWIVFGLGLAIAGLRRGRAIAALGLLSGTILCLFGVSDLVESSTGAWWRPWWLFLWKGTCLSGMVLCALKYRRISVPEPSLEVMKQGKAGSVGTHDTHPDSGCPVDDGAQSPVPR